MVQRLQKDPGMLTFLSSLGQIQASEHTFIAPGRTDGRLFNQLLSGAKLSDVTTKTWFCEPGGRS